MESLECKPVMSSTVSYRSGTWFTKIGNCYLLLGVKGANFPFHVLVRLTVNSSQHSMNLIWCCVCFRLAQTGRKCLSIIAPVILFISNIAIIWGAPIVAVAIFLLIVTLRYDEMLWIMIYWTWKLYYWTLDIIFWLTRMVLSQLSCPNHSVRPGHCIRNRKWSLCRGFNFPMYEAMLFQFYFSLLLRANRR